MKNRESGIMKGFIKHIHPLKKYKEYSDVRAPIDISGPPYFKVVHCNTKKIIEKERHKNSIRGRQ